MPRWRASCTLKRKWNGLMHTCESARSMCRLWPLPIRQRQAQVARNARVAVVAGRVKALPEDRQELRVAGVGVEPAQQLQQRPGKHVPPRVVVDAELVEAVVAGLDA